MSIIKRKKASDMSLASDVANVGRAAILITLMSSPLFFYCVFSACVAADSSLVDSKCSSFDYPLLEHAEPHRAALPGQTLLSGNP